MSTRTDLARRLELSQIEDVGDLVTGRVRGMPITLEGEPPFSGLAIDLGSALPIARMVMRPGDLNHPDAVETGDADFDDAMQVTALSSYAPTLQALLSERRIRDELLAFFKRHPEASFQGSRLHVPSAGGVTQLVIGDALALAQTVAERFATVGFLETEAAQRLPSVPTLWERAIRLGLGALIGGTLYVCIAAPLGLNPREGVGEI